MAGVAGVVVAKLQIPDGSWEVKGVFAIAIAVTVTALIGGLQGSFVAFIGVPSFVVTLAGLLFWQGVILYVIGDAGVIIIEDNTDQQRRELLLHGSAPGSSSPPIARALFALTTLSGVVSRRRHGIHTDNLILVAAKLVFVTAVIFGAVIWANQERGFPLAFVIVHHLPRLLDVGRRADDVRPPRLRGRRQRRGRATRGDQRRRASASTSS